MRRITVSILVAALACAISAFAQELLTLSWDTTRPLAGRVIEDSETGASVLALGNDTGGPLTSTFARIENPGVTAPSYAVRGMLRYEDVEGVGYLEMWSVFPDGGRYFSRTLGDVGPMQRISGSSGWREFTLPFSLMDAPQRPASLILNLTLEGRGSIFLGSLRLVQYKNDEEMMRAFGAGAGDGAPAAPAWWPPRAGEALLVLGGLALLLVSGLAFWLAERGRARRWGMASPWCAMALGLGALIGGALAVALEQPPWVQIPLLALGLLGSLLGVVLRRLVPARYTALELRRMQSQNIG